LQLDIQDVFAIVGFTSVLTIGAVIPVMYRFREHICAEIRDLAIRLGVVEKNDGSR
jgi:hypothetical protein